MSIVSRVGLTEIVGGRGALRTSRIACGGFLYVSCAKPETQSINKNTANTAVVLLNIGVSLSVLSNREVAVCSYLPRRVSSSHLDTIRKPLMRPRNAALQPGNVALRP